MHGARSIAHGAKERDGLVQDALIMLDELDPKLSETISRDMLRDIFREIFAHLAIDLARAAEDLDTAGRELGNYCLKVFSGGTPFSFSINTQQRMLIAARMVLENRLWETPAGGDIRDLQHHLAQLRLAFSSATIRLGRRWEAQFRQLRQSDLARIQDLKTVKTDLQKQLDIFYQIIKESPIAMIGCDSDLNVQMWNAAAARFTGYQRQDIIRKPLLQIIGKNDKAQLTRHLQSGHPYPANFRTQIHSKDGASLPALTAISQISYAERHDIHYLISLVDLRHEETLRRQMMQIETLTAISRLASTILHDIRNPLNTIGLNAEVIEQYLQEAGSLPGKVQTLLERIHAQIRQLNDSLTQYLGYSRLSEMQPAPVNLALRLQDLVLDMQVKFASQQIKLNFRSPAEKLQVFGDWLQLQRIFMNLLDNAADAIGREGIIELRLRRRGKRVLVSFSDNGCGMTPAEKRRIYTPYFSTKPSGTGLGLFVVREIVRAHRGRITCVTRPGQGTRFTLSFPQYPVAHMAEDR